jgi:hypothetical protein
LDQNAIKTRTQQKKQQKMLKQLEAEEHIAEQSVGLRRNKGENQKVAGI